MKRIRNLSLFFIFSMSIGLSFAFGWLCWQQANAFVDVPQYVANTTPRDFGFDDFENVEFVTDDNVTLHGWYISPTRDDGATLIFVHGHGGNLRDLIPEARLLTDMGYGALLFDLRGHGMSADASVTMGINEVRDVQAAFDFLRAQTDVNPERIGIHGFSMGAATSILAASQIPDIRVVIAEAPYSSIHQSLVDGIPRDTGIPALFFPDIIIAMSSTISGENYYDAAPIDVIEQLSQPVLITHGIGDSRIPYQHSEALFDSANEPKQLHLFDSRGHATAYRTTPNEFVPILLTFLDTHLLN